MNNCPNLYERISYITNCQYDFFLGKANVVGVGLGYKIKNGFNTCQKCIKVFVITKVSNDQLDFCNRIPSMYNGILTDVSEVGEFKFQLLNKKVRPTIGGYSIGPNVTQYHTNTGSIGCLVRDTHYNYLLSSAHVLSALNRLPVGTSIVQPSLLDMPIQGDQVGELARYVPLKEEGTFSKPTNLIDAAIVKVDPTVPTSPEIAFIGRARGVDTAHLNDAVFKAGRTTEETSGAVTAINVTCTVSILDGTRLKKYLFKNQIMTSKMSQEGDSGAVLVKANKKIIGLLVASCNSGTIYNRIQDVLQTLRVNIVL
ncbi:trypsin-like serine protease (plasmid) [Clostridium botulinum]|uniref:trypsin-like serine protease n=1 Tax=Clostridium botulinum TaxID=1491 RepID=UPI0004D35310|nr:trypsin-like serine protease [Clostridium botulinum]KEI00028.1 hypothetical protein Z952_14485 [Clostridium botulinum C/D str. BKT75002]KEI05812.1 hypothetical protein Z954_14640 [Clostridium botulinum C/D str. BKT2873]KOC54608.1 hypothetical protein ADU90_12370 [Clostridium botulinum]KOC55577.1 hypothetical protein ADU89_05145 [Clostridium botulinum]MCD3235394.1 trypsin-like serine protease [Clostridium botulinum D/C]